MKAELHSSYWVQLTFDNKAERDVVADATSFKIPGAQFSPQVKAGIWDGKKRFLTAANKLPAGLFSYLFPNNNITGNRAHVDLTFDDLDLYKQFPHFEKRQYQLDAVNSIFRHKRGIIEAVVGSGKSLISALAIRQHLNQDPDNNKALFVVYDKNILSQTVRNYKSYGFKVSQFGDGKRDFTGEVVVATIQSLSRLKDAQKEFNRYTMTFTDECFPGTTKIITEDGPLTLADINRRKYSGKVLSRNADTGEFEYKEITGYLKKVRTNTVGYVGLGASTRVVSTDNHEILTMRGYVRADAVTLDDIVLCQAGGQDAFPLIDPASMAYQVAVASSLGDGYIAVPHAESLVYRLTINQGIAQADYNDFKMGWFDCIGHSPTRMSKSGYTGAVSIYSRSTKGSPTFTQISKMSKIERINALDLRGLGILFLDDGSLNQATRKCGVIHCNSFTSDEANALLAKLHSFNVDSNVAISSRGHYYINIRTAGMQVLAPFIAQCAPASMRYKVPMCASTVTCVVPKVPERVEYGMCVRSVFRPSKTQVPNVYCIEVADNHNFVLANGVVVHNCHHSSSKTSRDVISKLKNCQYFIGLTGTPPDQKSLDFAELATATGGIIYKFGFAAAAAEKKIVPIKTFFVKYDSSDETIDSLMFRKNYKVIWDNGVQENAVRNALIADINKRLLDTYSNSGSLICVDRTEHGNRIATAVGSTGVRYQESYGVDNVLSRDAKRESLMSGDTDTIISSVITEGVDMAISPIFAINAMGRVSPTKAIQFIGRAVRKNPHYKNFRVAIDFIDTAAILLREHSLQRIQECANFEIATQVVDNIDDLMTEVDNYYRIMELGEQSPE